MIRRFLRFLRLGDCIRAPVRRLPSVIVAEVRGFRLLYENLRNLRNLRIICVSAERYGEGDAGTIPDLGSFLLLSALLAGLVALSSR
jgi:hypothetical protein